MTRLEKRLQEAKAMRQLADDLRTKGKASEVHVDYVFARLAEAIAVLLEELP